MWGSRPSNELSECYNIMLWSKWVSFLSLNKRFALCWRYIMRMIVRKCHVIDWVCVAYACRIEFVVSLEDKQQYNSRVLMYCEFMIVLICIAWRPAWFLGLFFINVMLFLSNFPGNKFRSSGVKSFWKKCKWETKKPPYELSLIWRAVDGRHGWRF